MSGSAALSAARKRRASTAPSLITGAPSAMYAPSKPENMQRQQLQPPRQLQQQQYPNQNGMQMQDINIYENIELIKQQLLERTKLIQTQGSSIPPDKLRVLHKQNEIQTQILMQKMAIAKQMEMVEKQEPIMNESEFIYEKGVPRKNPNYKVAVETPLKMHNNNNNKSSSASSSSSSATRGLTPFVSMLLDTGVVPPPIVVLKSHDAKLEEHNQILHNILHKLDDLQSSNDDNTAAGVSYSEVDKPRSSNNADNADNAEEDDEELLMDVVMNDLTNSREFVEGIVNKIVNETNLSEVIMKIEPLVKENQELRSLIHSQQQMMNEMNTMLLRLLNGNNHVKEEQDEDELREQSTYQDNGLDDDGLYQPEMTEIVLSHYDEEPELDVELTVTTNNIVSLLDVNDVDTISEKAPDATEATEATEAPEAPEADDHLVSVDPTIDQELDYSAPHFPNEPISLVVTDM
jgi:hypothetical protein